MTTAPVGTEISGFLMTFRPVLAQGDATAWAERRREAQEWLRANSVLKAMGAAEAFLSATRTA